MKLNAVLKLAAVSAIAIVAAGGAFAKDAKEVKIGFLQRTLTAPYYVAMWDEAERLAGEKGFTLVASQADGDAVKQMQQLEDMMSRGVDALVVNAVDPVTSEAAFREVVEGGLPVVFIDVEIPDIGAAATFGADNEGIGVLAGKSAAKRLGAGPIKMGVLEGFPGDVFVGPAREKGFLAGLTEGGTQFEIVARGQANYSQDLAVAATEDMLTAQPEIQMIFGYNDSMALGAQSVIGDRDIKVAGIDGQKEAFAEIAKGCDGKYLSTGLNSPTLAARDGFNLALEIATGAKELPKDQKLTYTQVAGIDCENVKEFYDPASAF